MLNPSVLRASETRIATDSISGKIFKDSLINGKKYTYVVESDDTRQTLVLTVVDAAQKDFFFEVTVGTKEGCVGSDTGYVRLTHNEALLSESEGSTLTLRFFGDRCELIEIYSGMHGTLCTFSGDYILLKGDYVPGEKIKK